MLVQNNRCPELGVIIRASLNKGPEGVHCGGASVPTETHVAALGPFDLRGGRAQGWLTMS